MFFYIWTLEKEIIEMPPKTEERLQGKKKRMRRESYDQDTLHTCISVTVKSVIIMMLAQHQSGCSLEKAAHVR